MNDTIHTLHVGLPHVLASFAGIKIHHTCGILICTGKVTQKKTEVR